MLILIYPDTKNEARRSIAYREHSGRKFLNLVRFKCLPKVATAGYIWYIPLSFVAWWAVFCNSNPKSPLTTDRSSSLSLQQGICTLGVNRLVLAFVSPTNKVIYSLTAERTMRVHEHQRANATTASRQRRPPTSKQPEPNTILDISSSLNTNFLFKERPLELDLSWHSDLSEPTERRSSPISDAGLCCDGFQLCEDYSVEAPCVVSHISLVTCDRSTPFLTIISADCFWSIHR